MAGKKKKINITANKAITFSESETDQTSSDDTSVEETGSDNQESAENSSASDSESDVENPTKEPESSTADDSDNSSTSPVDTESESTSSISVSKYNTNKEESVDEQEKEQSLSLLSSDGSDDDLPRDGNKVRRRIIKCLGTPEIDRMIREISDISLLPDTDDKAVDDALMKQYSAIQAETKRFALWRKDFREKKISLIQRTNTLIAKKKSYVAGLERDLTLERENDLASSSSTSTTRRSKTDI